MTKKKTPKSGDSAMPKKPSWADHFDSFDAFGATPFDPWPLVYMFERLRAAPDDFVHLKMWSTLYKGLEEAQARWNGPAVRSPREQAHAAEQCLLLRPAIEGGAGGPLLEAVALCAAHGIAMPAWIARPYVERHWAARSGAYKGWEDVFGPIRGTVKAREAQAMGLDTYRAALAILENDPCQSLNSAFDEEVGALVGRGHSSARTIYDGYIAAVDAAPLAYVKQHLEAGGSLQSAASAWFNEKMDRLAAPSANTGKSRVRRY